MALLFFQKTIFTPLYGLNSKGYIAHHLHVAGAANALFTDAAIEIIHELHPG
jgi:hypothetical protein